MARSCPICGVGMLPHPGEKPSHFARRKTCGRRCASRLPKKVDQPRYLEEDCGYATPCWVWQRSKNPNGYGNLRVDKKLLLAHRWSYERHVGPIPVGLELDHLCRVRACVNPGHLEPVTRTQHARRALQVRFTEEQVAQIKGSPMGSRRLARAYDAPRATIMAIRQGRSWKDVEAA